MTAILSTTTEAQTLGQIIRRADALGLALILAGDLDAPPDHIRRLDAELTEALHEETAQFERLRDSHCNDCGSSDGCLSYCDCRACENQRALDEDADRYFDCD